MEKIILIHIPIFLLGLNIYDVIQDEKFIWKILYLKIFTIS
jgi:hypothetical protein